MFHTMPDPLSVSASLVAIVGAGISVGKTLEALIRDYRETPVAVTALSNEVSDLVLVLTEVRAVVDQNAGQTVQTTLVTVLERADAKLVLLKTFVDGLDAAGKLDRVERVKWTRKKKKAALLKKELAVIKGDLILLMGSRVL